MPTSRFRFDFVGNRIYERVTALIQMYIYLYTRFFPHTQYMFPSFPLTNK